MVAFSTLPQTAKAQPTPYNVSISEEKTAELKQLLKLSKIGPETYENRHAEPTKGKLGLTRQWLLNAKEEWLSFDW